jgi:hypothetical protein
MITIPVSLGEVIDKLTILDIKKTEITDIDKLKHIQKEFDELSKLTESYLQDKKLKILYSELIEINYSLWKIEDSLRDLEREKRFDDKFIGLAREVYYTNDERFKIKNKINLISNSEIQEQKSYKEYK